MPEPKDDWLDPILLNRIPDTCSFIFKCNYLTSDFLQFPFQRLVEPHRSDRIP